MKKFSCGEIVCRPGYITLTSSQNGPLKVQTAQNRDLLHSLSK